MRPPLPQILERLECHEQRMRFATDSAAAAHSARVPPACARFAAAITHRPERHRCQAGVDDGDLVGRNIACGECAPSRSCR